MGLFGGGAPDNSAQMADLAKRQKLLDSQEAEQKKDAQARKMGMMRRAFGGSAVAGTGAADKNSTLLGGG
jgi:hypothetical protein